MASRPGWLAPSGCRGPPSAAMCARSWPSPWGVLPPAGSGRPPGGQPPRAKEGARRQRCTIRLPDPLHERLQRAADTRKCGLSDVIRLAITDFLSGGHSGNDTPPSMADPAAAPHDQDRCAQTLASPPLSPQVSGTARLQGEGFISWQEFKKRFQQVSPEAVRPAAAPSSAAPAPGRELHH